MRPLITPLRGHVSQSVCRLSLLFKAIVDVLTGRSQGVESPGSLPLEFGVSFLFRSDPIENTYWKVRKKKVREMDTGDGEAEQFPFKLLPEHSDEDFLRCRPLNIYH